ncbi:MAG: hypothetical protein ACLUES_13320 [Flavonifractor plautii]
MLINGPATTLSQEWLLAHIPMDRKVLREFLKAGVASAVSCSPRR